jgi:hypothetical protein
LAPDPVEFLTPHLTPYHYCSNNPINRIDFTGMNDEDDDAPYVGTLPSMDVTASRIYDGPSQIWLMGYERERRHEQIENQKPSFTRSVELWVNERWPQANEDDSWLYKVIRGTGDLRKDTYYFAYGIWGVGLITGSGTIAVATYGPSIYYAYQSFKLAAGIQLNYMASTAATQLGIATGTGIGYMMNVAINTYLRTSNLYLANAPGINRTMGSISKFVTPLSRTCWETSLQQDFHYHLIKLSIARYLELH